jgi:hypothetical protein
MIGATRLFAGKGAARDLATFGRPDLLLVSDLKQALRQPGCPLCRVLRDADLRYLRVFLREGKDDGRMLLRLLASWGLCARHAGGLVRLEPVDHGDGLGTGTLYDWLLHYARRRLEDFRHSLAAHDDPATARRRRPSRRTIDRALARLRRTGRCPACEAQRQYAAYVMAEFAKTVALGEELPEIRDMYLAGDGLCLPHWRAVEELLSSPDARALVAEKQREMVASLKAALEADLARGVGAEPGEGETGDPPAYARALAKVAGDTEWQRPAG